MRAVNLTDCEEWYHNPTHHEHNLILKMEKAEGFDYDDESVALSNSLAERDLTWIWARNDSGREVVKILSEYEVGIVKWRLNEERRIEAANKAHDAIFGHGD